MPDINDSLDAIPLARRSFSFAKNHLTSLPDEKANMIKGVNHVDARISKSALPNGNQIHGTLTEVTDPSLGVAAANNTGTAPNPPPISVALPAVDNKIINWTNNILPTFPNISNHISSPLDQGGCGSCVSFAVTAMLEAMCSIKHGKTVNLSEGELYYCLGGNGACQPWSVHTAIDKTLVNGIVENSVYSYFDVYNYSSGEATVGVCPNPNLVNKVKATNSVLLNTISDTMTHLLNIGPVVATMQLFRDFDAYSSGVYQYLSGNFKSLHAVLIVGFDNTAGNQYWICKNSYGSSWGENGFFKIKMGQVGIDTYTKYGITNVSIPAGIPSAPPTSPVGQVAGVVAPNYTWTPLRQAGLPAATFAFSKPNVTSFNETIFITFRDSLSKVKVYRLNLVGATYTYTLMTDANLPSVIRAPNIAAKDATKLYACGVSNTHDIFVTEGTIVNNTITSWGANVNRQGSVLSDPSMYINHSNNKLYIAARNTRNQLIVKTCNLANNVWDADWKILSGNKIMRGNTSITKDSVGNTMIFAQAEDGNIFSTTQNSSGIWSALATTNIKVLDHFTIVANPVLANPTFRLEMFYLDETGRILHRYLEDGKGWSSAAVIDSLMSVDGIAVCERVQDKLELFSLNMGSQLYFKSRI